MLNARLTYAERANYCLTPLGRHLFQLLDEKKTNLALSADVTSADRLLQLADEIGPEICILKTHIDIIEDYTPSLTQSLRQLAQQHQFILFEDRKFADIGHTVQLQYQGGIYRIADWAELVNAHALPGPGIVKGLADVGRLKNRAALLIAEMSSAGHLMDHQYQQKTLAIAEQFADFVIGFITQHAFSSDPHWLNLTPGIKLEDDADSLGQRYISPRRAILEYGSDIIIVGRGILAAENPLQAAKAYRTAGFNAYLERLLLGKTG
jgi:uridine monophosphate synthetase